MKHKWHKLEKGQGLVEYALLLTLVSVAAILAIEVFGVKLQNEYCEVLNALGTSETFCSTDESGHSGETGSPDDNGDTGESGDTGDTGNPGSGGENNDPGSDDNIGDPGSGGDEGDDDDPGNGDGNQPTPDPTPEPQPGVITLFHVQSKNNKNHKEVWFTAQFNGDYVDNVVLTAYLGGESKVMMRENGNKYRAAWQSVSFPVELRIVSHDHLGRYLDAELSYTITGDENGRFN